MTEEQLSMVVDSYGIELLLQVNDIEQEYVVKLLIDEGLIDIMDVEELFYVEEAKQ